MRNEQELSPERREFVRQLPPKIKELLCKIYPTYSGQLPNQDFSGIIGESPGRETIAMLRKAYEGGKKISRDHPIATGITTAAIVAGAIGTAAGVEIYRRSRRRDNPSKNSPRPNSEK